MPDAGAGTVRAMPHLREFLADELTPLAIYRKLRDRSPYRFLLESVSSGGQVSRWSFLGGRPSEVYFLFPDRVEVEGPDGERVALEGRPLAVLRQRLERIRAEPLQVGRGEVPFTGGFVGYFGWDLVRMLERLGERPPDPFGLPVAMLARYDALVVFDHVRQRMMAISNEVEGEIDRAAAFERLEEMTAVLQQVGSSQALALPDGVEIAAEVGPPSLSAEQYRDAVSRAKQYIRAGDIFQVVLARRWEIERSLDPLLLYRALRTVNPSPYMVLVESPEVSLVGGSPEMLVRAKGDRFGIRPIAGTRPRGATAADDARLAREMLADPKERAEHVMLVDLGRNDLGRVSAPDQVEVPTFMEIEYYSHVMHIVSSVEARRGPGRTALDALFATFPAGTLSGAPKIRAMQIIDELEPEARGVYGGAVGYLSYTGDLDTCIAIRTLVVEPGRTTVTAGAGLVADSDPYREEEETRNKAAALLHAVALAAEMQRRGAE
ncbi:MAG: anthranilate synthase component I [Acidobacteria bacterium]|nr:MAG: anthranilate synthase component I [Acidobacteriota bacterium]REK07867.1 MAG: anthranilate synthase component I [Acidobacteriota bacterium]